MGHTSLVPRLLAAAAIAGIVGAGVFLFARADGELSPADDDASPAIEGDDACRTEEPGGDRVAGPDRFATAACASRVAYPDAGAVDHVVLARGDAQGELADALAGAVLADHVGGPVLLALPQQLPEATREEIARLGPDTVTILGGTSAVGAPVAAEVDELAGDVERLAGSTRVATAARISERARASDTAFVVNGFRPADSLVAAAPAARQRAGLLQVHQDRVPQVTSRALDDVENVVVVGGHTVVSDTVAAELRGTVDGSVRRVAGGNRGETSASMARAFPAGERVHLAAAADDNLVDAVTAGWMAARGEGGSVVYSLPDRPLPAVERWLRLGGLGTSDELVPVRLVGGGNVLTDELVAQLQAYYEEVGEGGPPDEIRGWWVHAFDDTLHTRESLHQMLDEAARSGANTIIAQVSRRQDATYASSHLPRLPEPGLSAGLDVLAELVPAAHDRGLQVHAWSSVLPAYHEDYDALELPADHVWRRHGPGSDEPWVSADVNGNPGKFLDPGVPGVQQHVVDALTEIAANYDVDGVHLDYLRYAQGDVRLAADGNSGVTGYNDIALQRFDAQTGRGTRPDPSDEHWSAWRRAQTRDLMHRVRAEIAEVAPDVAVSQAAITWGAPPDDAGGLGQTPTFRWVFQNWPRWLQEGAIDVAVPMNYFAEPRWAGRFEGWTTWQDRLSHDGLLAVGQGALLNSAPDSIAQLQRARPRADGAVVYSYQQQTDEQRARGLAGRLGSGMWAQPAGAPDLVGDRADGHVIVTAEDGVTVELEGAGDPRTERGDATGRATFLHVAPGEVTVDADGFQPATADVTAGGVTRLTLSSS